MASYYPTISVTVAALRKMVATASSPTGVIDEDGCCPGLPGAPQIQCARELIALANEVDYLKQDHAKLNRDVQEMSELIDSVNYRFAPCSQCDIPLAPGWLNFPQ
ncbi:hypothetical protein DSO57_1023042 [Entomophthora muscae]|uniref:Uncharacterized protein n=1 Tax=Entomophthora muscae TaxID=34485 RepID=A0ACC2UMW3_9FUNG|nr:hypothetical protein DSO57_1023042 [Entomophthora muscae]